MSYDYKTERPNLFTEDGQLLFLKIRDRTMLLLKEAGAARAEEIMREACGSSWLQLACIDRMVELGELREVTRPGECYGQYRVFTSTRS